jgi:hypothetical protein
MVRLAVRPAQKGDGSGLIVAQVRASEGSAFVSSRTPPLRFATEAQTPFGLERP